MDTSPVPLWEGCPDVDAYVGNDSWTYQLNVSNQSLYCAYPEDGSDENPQISLKMAYADKGQLRLVPGSYPLPAETPGNNEGSSTPFVAPMCYRNAEGDVFASNGTGSMAIEVVTLSVFYFDPITGGEREGDIQQFDHLQYLTNSSGDTMDMRLIVEYLNYAPENPGSVNITGRYSEYYLMAEDPSFAHLHTKTRTLENRWQRFYPCLFFDLASTPHEFKVTFDGGEIVLDTDIEPGLPASAGTEPYSFVHASGSLNGVSFDQYDYWKLVYAPEHHHFVRHYAVLFDDEISGACGLMVTGIDPHAEPLSTGVAVHTINCNIDPVDSLEVTSVEKLF